MYIYRADPHTKIYFLGSHFLSHQYNLHYEISSLKRHTLRLYIHPQNLHPIINELFINFFFFFFLFILDVLYFELDDKLFSFL